MKKLILAALAALSLSGCIVAPVGVDPYYVSGPVVYPEGIVIGVGGYWDHGVWYHGPYHGAYWAHCRYYGHCCARR